MEFDEAVAPAGQEESDSSQSESAESESQTPPQATQSCHSKYDCLVVRKLLSAKDEGVISDEAYHRLRQALPKELRKKIPPINVLKDERKSENHEIKIIPVPEVSCLISYFLHLFCLQPHQY